MKNVLLILDGKIAKSFLDRLIDLNHNTINHYDVVYTDDSLVFEEIPSNFTFYQFDPTSYSKLSFILNKTLYQYALIVLNNKDDLLAVISNIRSKYKNLNFTVYDQWNIKLDDKHIQYYRGYDILSNGLVEQLPNIPVFAQNIGNKKGEIMEIRIPFSSSYLYRYIGSISQKGWKIVALYRNEELIDINEDIVLKANDTIIAIGAPEVLMQVYKAISTAKNLFPMPFGKNIYFYINMYIQTEDEILDAIEDAKILHQRMKNKCLIIRITQPTTVESLNKIRFALSHIDNLEVDIDYGNKGMKNILIDDKVKYDIGLLILTKSILLYKNSAENLYLLKLPIFKVGKEHISSLKTATIVLNDNKKYEQISPTLFDISSQLKLTPKVFDLDPIGDKNRGEIIDYINNLAKIFTQNIIVVSERSNPIKRLQQEQDILQILPLDKKMFNKRRTKFFNTNSDLVSFDLEKYNQIILPIVDEIS